MNVIVRPKRGPGPFTVISHAKGIIQNKSGRRKWGGFPSRAAAEEWRAEVWLCLRRGHDPIALTDPSEASPSESNGLTLGEFIETLVAQWKMEDFKHSTFRCYRNVAQNQIKSALGSIPLVKLDSGTLGAYFAQLRGEGKSEKTIKNIRSILSVILGEAQERGLIGEVPMPQLPRHRRGKRRASHRRKKFETWAQEDLLRFLNKAQELEPTYAPALVTLGLVPLRPNELLGLHWADLDTHRQHLMVRRTRSTFSSRNPVVEELTKTGEKKVLDIPDGLLSVLEEHREAEFQRGRGLEGHWLFYEEDGQPMRYERLYAAFQRLFRVLKLRPIRLYDLRHSWATIHLREIRNPIQWVSRQMGHATIALTADLYGYVEIDSDLGLANKIGGKELVSEDLAPTDDPQTTLYTTHPLRVQTNSRT
jgi:integrase